ncbi:MAG: NAD(P)/FAD-dependent oxidoreductase [Muribaculaceae bacterium]|nr:NAD(P)/FAD-dependent oxidoreductase [Muribaculaceae bacterium]
MSPAKQKIAIIAGAGPAGLTAAYELARTEDIRPVVFETSDIVGGLSGTINYKGNRIDIGGHRFFSKNEEVMKWWLEVMPMQSSPACDELLLGATRTGGTADPEMTDRVMLRRNRVSRIYYLRRFFDYPVTLSKGTLSAMGFSRTVKAGIGYLLSVVKKQPETTLENFYINRFGKPLYQMFFENYTEKVWGVHPSCLGADWGVQRVKGLSIRAILRDIFTKKLVKKRDSSKVETSLIEEFIYPKYGPGQLWETVADEAKKAGAVIELETTVKKVHIDNDRVVAVTVVGADGAEKRVDCDFFISSMPIKNLVASLEGTEVPADVSEIAAALPYRDFITVGILVKDLNIKNRTKIRTYNDRIPDTWIYVQERDVKLGRIQIFNNWSPYMVKDYENTIWLGLEYFCNEGDEMWNMADNEFIKMAINELESIGIIDSGNVVDAVRIKMPKAYPAYFGGYYQIDKVKMFLDKIQNLYCIGRNGQHRYNNMDHSIMTALETVRAIERKDDDRSAIWNVNTEKENHEKK